jgi:mono/diheme cytochrome c family protein
MRAIVWLTAIDFATFHGQVAYGQNGSTNAANSAYGKRCALCHGDDGTPKEALEKIMKVEIDHLASPEVQAMNDDDLRKVIVDGVGKMKPVKGISNEEVDQVIAFVRTLRNA